jgi:hypothetical protein
VQFFHDAVTGFAAEAFFRQIPPAAQSGADGGDNEQANSDGQEPSSR